MKESAQIFATVWISRSGSDCPICSSVEAQKMLLFFRCLTKNLIGVKLFVPDCWFKLVIATAKVIFIFISVLANTEQWLINRFSDFTRGEKNIWAGTEPRSFCYSSCCSKHQTMAFRALWKWNLLPLQAVFDYVIFFFNWAPEWASLMVA